MKTVKQINFEEALERTRNGETVYAVNLKVKEKPVTKLFRNLVIGDAIETDYIYQVVIEEARV